MNVSRRWSGFRYVSQEHFLTHELRGVGVDDYGPLFVLHYDSARTTAPTTTITTTASWILAILCAFFVAICLRASAAFGTPYHQRHSAPVMGIRGFDSAPSAFNDHHRQSATAHSLVTLFFLSVHFSSLSVFNDTFS